VRRKFYRLFLLIPLMALLLAACVTDNNTRNMSDTELSNNYYQQGVGYMDLGKIEIAREKLEYALKINSDNSKAHDALAALYESIKVYGKAKEHYQASLELSPNDPSAINNFGGFLCRQGEYAAGMRYLQQAIDYPLNNRKWYALTNAGLCENAQGHQQQAENYLREALQLQPDFSPALLEMLRINYQQGDYIPARAFFQRYQGAVGDTPETLWMAYQIERALGHSKQAQQYRQQLLSQFPSSEYARKVQGAY
jgi:type IV pilus assembly protein PilF